MARQLAAAGCVAAEEEAAELVRAASDEDDLESMVARRSTGEPLSWITGTAAFCGLTVLVDPGVYVPRWQSETLARRAAELLADTGTAVDLCTGTGAVALALAAARPGARVVATEVDPRAAACARRNGVHVVEGHLADPLPVDLAGTVDLMTGVLPYVPTDGLHLLPRDVLAFEPHVALDGGADGLVLVTEAVAAGTRWVRPGGWLLLEVGTDQVDGVGALFRSAGYGSVTVLDDEEGDPRAVAGQRYGGPVDPSGGQASSR